ncbi:VOC family protein [Selenomonas ruminis]|uniref:VOC family protein n=1 Tax=Selenomonas ruminis TaxID=2593411 RepID=A0A5D6W8V3_9FIRM|nr:VOC family protein [Selenomonas sp. mPRGC5]TYZ24713.1 VOC family protein [Selenomonas sp. mPRGC5]
MKIEQFDHLVLVTNSLTDCLRFYGDVLGMTIECKNNRYALRFGQQKINIHTRKAEFLPAAQYPTPGSLDLCLVVSGPMAEVKRELMEKGLSLETDIVARNGAQGNMQSIYLRDPDGNLVELCSYEDSEVRSWNRK